ncbi:MAG: S8 family serine peptidase [Verrucomicrobiota bacterium]|nr:S8 family serine peptidase [Verrucomicrobiota bacterium]
MCSFLRTSCLVLRPVLLLLFAGLIPTVVLIGAPPQTAPGFAKKAIREPHHRDRLLVKFRDEVAPAEREAAHGRAGTKLLKRFEHLHNIEVRQVSPGKSVEQTISDYDATGLVEYAEPDYEFKASLAPNDPSYLNGSQWDLNNTGQNSGVVDADVDGPEAWNVRTSAASVVVAVIDSGGRYTHQDLAANMWRNPGETAGNGVDDDHDGYTDDVFGINTVKGTGNPNDDNGHGTHVSGTIGAIGNNGLGVAGVAWNVKLMECKFLDSTGSGYTSDAITCIDYARQHGAQIINNSWGGGGYSQALYDAIAQLRTAGIIFVVAAGNDATNNDTTPTYPANYNLDNIVSVAATTRTDALATYSNYGANTVALAAPGSGITSTYNSGDAAYTAMSGTSMAAPHVTALFALLKAQFPAESYLQLIQRAMSSVDQLPSLTGKVKGGGRINLYKALTGAASAPANNNFANATVSTGDSFQVTGTNKNATKESGEPFHAGNAGGASVWWKWTAKATGSVIVTTSGSSFDTLLGVYTGTSVGALTTVASNDNASGVVTSALSFNASANVTYYFAVDGNNGATGNITLAVTGPASGTKNDFFANRIAVTGSSFATTGDNRLATRETGEPNHAGVPGGKSVWWSWTAPTSGYVVIDTFASTFDTLLGVYTGTSVSVLTRIAGNDDASAYTNQSKVTFYAYAGRAYRIAVDGYYGATGDIRLEGYYK